MGSEMCIRDSNCFDCGNYHAEESKNSEDDHRDTSEAGSHSSSTCVRLEYEIQYPDFLEYETEDPEECEECDSYDLEEDVLKPKLTLDSLAYSEESKNEEEEEARHGSISSESTAETFSLTDSARSDLDYHQQNTSYNLDNIWADVYKQQQTILKDSKQRMKMYRQCYSQEEEGSVTSGTSDTINKLKVRKRELEVYRKSISNRYIAEV